MKTELSKGVGGEGGTGVLRGLFDPLAVFVLAEIQLLEVWASSEHLQQFGEFQFDGRLVVKAEERKVLEIVVGPRGVLWD